MSCALPLTSETPPGHHQIWAISGRGKFSPEPEPQRHLGLPLHAGIPLGAPVIRSGADDALCPAGPFVPAPEVAAFDEEGPAHSEPAGHGVM